MIKYDKHLPYEYNESCEEKYNRLLNDIFVNTVDINNTSICFSKIFLIHKLSSMNRTLDIFKKDINKLGYDIEYKENEEVIILHLVE